MKPLLILPILLTTLSSNQQEKYENLFKLNSNQINTIKQSHNKEKDYNLINSLLDNVEKKIKFAHNRLNYSSKYIDEYITNEKDETVYLKSYIRIENSVEKFESESIDYQPNIDIRIILPKLKDKLSLTIENSEKEIINEQFQDSNEKIDDGEKEYTIGLLYNTVKKNTLFNFKIGLSPYIYAQALVSKDFEIDKNNTINLKKKYKYSHKNKLDSYTTLRYDHTINPIYSFHSFNEYHVNSESKVEKLYNSLRIYQKLSNTKYLNYVASLESDDFESSFKTKEYKTYVSFRDFIRNWLYYDIVPSIKWDRENNFHSDLGLKFNLGILIKR